MKIRFITRPTSTDTILNALEQTARNGKALVLDKPRAYLYAAAKRRGFHLEVHKRCVFTPCGRNARIHRREDGMATDLATKQDTALLLERVVVGGDLSKLTATERMQYYAEVCKSVGLNPLTQPFASL